MTSTRHNTYLDAARACLVDVGWRRTTLTDVARRAGVSRMTIYRAWPDMGALLADLMTREWQQMLAGAATSGGTGAAEIADIVVAVSQVVRSNDLFRKILEVDPEQLLPYLLQRPGRSQEAILSMLVPAIAAGQAAGTVRAGNPELIARTLLLAAHGLTLSGSTMTTDTVSPPITEGDLDAELRTVLLKGLQP
jgi:AcrR family transcriptional regulator